MPLRVLNMIEEHCKAERHRNRYPHLNTTTALNINTVVCYQN